jgi:hypothetical protein
MKTWIIAAGLGIALSTAGATGAFAQAGSTGGTIGQTNKSVSGGEDQTEIRRPTRPSTPPASQGAKDWQTLPGTIQFNEHGALGSYSATLRRVGGSEYEATWNVAVTSRMTVRMTKDSMTFQRRDTSNAWGLASGAYVGTRTGNSASGSFSIGVNHGTWDASW